MATTKKKTTKKTKVTRKTVARKAAKKTTKKVTTRDYKITVEGSRETVSVLRNIVLEAPKVTFVVRKARTEGEAKHFILTDEDRRSILRKTGIPVDAVRKAKVELA